MKNKLLASALMALFWAPRTGALAVEGHCVAFCDEEPAAGVSAPIYQIDYSSYRQSPNRDWVKQYNDEGMSLRQRGDYRGAIAAYEKAIPYAYGYTRAAEDNRILIENIGAAQCYIGIDAYNRGDLEEAIRWFRLSVAADPNDENRMKWLTSSISKKEDADRKAREAAESSRNHEIVNPLPTYSGGDAFSAPVDLRDKQAGRGELPTLDPKTIRGAPPEKPRSLKTRRVPLPEAIRDLNRSKAFQKDIYDGVESRADMILDALERGGGSLEKSIWYLEGRVNAEGQGSVGTDALSYLEGMRAGAIAVDAEVEKGYDLFKDEELAAFLGAADNQGRSGEMDDEMLEALEKMIKEQERQYGIEDWRTARTQALLDALQEGRGNIRKSLDYLDRQRNDLMSSPGNPYEDAHSYLQGLQVYPGLISDAGTAASTAE